MKYFFSLLPSLILTFLLTSSVQARSAVKVQNTINGETSKVEVESNNSDSSSINVRIKENGEVRTFEVTGKEEITWDSQDGSTSVRVNQSQSAIILPNEDTGDEPQKSSMHNEDTNRDSQDSRSETSEVDKVSSNETLSLSTIVAMISDFVSSLFPRPL